jgi:2-hydroxychromene-2-carboxylate isomerase
MPTKFPMKTSPALRGALTMRRFGKEWEFMERIFAAYWEKNDASVGELSGLRPIAAELGVDQAEFETLVESDEIRNELIAETDRGLERGVFGVPTFFVGDEMFWGKDRMEFIDDELTTPSRPRVRRSPSALAVSQHHVHQRTRAVPRRFPHAISRDNCGTGIPPYGTREG